MVVMISALGCSITCLGGMQRIPRKCILCFCFYGNATWRIPGRLLSDILKSNIGNGVCDSPIFPVSLLMEYSEQSSHEDGGIIVAAWDVCNWFQWSRVAQCKAWHVLDLRVSWFAIETLLSKTTMFRNPQMVQKTSRTIRSVILVYAQSWQTSKGSATLNFEKAILLIAFYDCYDTTIPYTNYLNR